MTETLTFTPETYSQHEISAHLNLAAQQVAEYAYNSEFHQQLADAGVNFSPTDSAKRWEITANYAARKASSENLSSLEKHSLQLVGFLPNFLNAQHELSKGALTHSERKDAKRTACVYNGLLRDFATKYPQSPAELHASLLDATLQTMGSESGIYLDDADSTLASTLKGVKHELAFAATLDAFGIPYRAATTQEDLAGRDIVLRIGEREVGVDIKASLNAVDAKNNGFDGTPVSIKPNGDLIVFSLFTDSDFGDSFTPSKEALDLKAMPIAGYLQAAVNQSIAK